MQNIIIISASLIILTFIIYRLIIANKNIKILKQISKKAKEKTNGKHN